MYLIVKNNKKQANIYFSSSNFFSGVTYDKYADAVDYFNLRMYADSVANENARLYSLIDESKYTVSSWRDTGRTEKYQQRYTYIPAKVINSSINRYNNYLTLDKGATHGIKPGMGVISNLGIVGIVKSSSDHFSQVMSILHKQSSISASIRRNNFHGSLVWKERNPRHITLERIPKHADIIVGDTIETSGYSTKFPKGLLIGVVDTFWTAPGSNYYTVDVLLKKDLSNIKYVYVVDDLMRAEQNSLEEEVADE